MAGLPEPWGWLGRVYGLRPGSIIAQPLEGLIVHRLVTNDPPERSDFGPISRKRAEIRQLAELERTGLSHFLTVEDALAVKWKDEQRVGRYMLPAGQRIHVARTDQTRPGHVELWIPADLVDEVLAATEIVA